MKFVIYNKLWDSYYLPPNESNVNPTWSIDISHAKIFSNFDDAFQEAVVAILELSTHSIYTVHEHCSRITILPVTKQTMTKYTVGSFDD